MTFLILIIAFFTLCAYQDVRSRAVQWFIFLGILVSAIGVNWENLSLTTILYNGAFLVFMMAMLTLYVMITRRKVEMITNGYFSWGDILFLIAIIPLFSFESYVFFFTIGTCLTLVMHLAAMLVSKEKSIPYAGYMSIVAVAYLFFEDQILYQLFVA